MVEKEQNAQESVFSRLLSLRGLATIFQAVFLFVLSWQGYFIAHPASGQSVADNRYAIIVGINDYDNEEVTTLHYAVNDARAMKDLLIKKMGLKEENIFLYTSDKKQSGKPSRTNVGFALEQIGKEMKPGGTFIFFFSGHGIYMEGESYLLTMEADPRSKVTLEDSCLKFSRVKALIQDMKADRVLLMVDACRSDPRGNKGGGRNYMQDDFAKGLVIKGTDHGVQSAPQVKVTATLHSCSPGESSYESGDLENGYFTHFIIKGLSGDAANSGGRVTLNSLERYLSKNVPIDVKREKGQVQTPWMDRCGANIDAWSLAEGKATSTASSPSAQRASQLISRDAACELSSVFGNCRPLPAFLTGEGKLYAANLPGTKDFADEFAFHTDMEDNPFIIIDLKNSFTITGFEIENRKRQCRERAEKLTIWTSRDKVKWEFAWCAESVKDRWSEKLPATSARYVKIGIPGKSYFHLARVKLYGFPAQDFPEN